MHSKKNSKTDVVAESSSSNINKFQQALQLHQQGQLEQAEVLYQQILPTQPEYADALHLLGVIAKQRDQNQLAIDLINQSLSINPDNAAAHSNIALAFQALDHFDDALASYDRALIIQPDYAEALFNRGITLQCLKRLDEAVASYDRALVFQPDNAETLFNRGVALQDLKRYEPALASYNRTLAIKPDHAEALYALGIVLNELGRSSEALASYDRALAIKPDYAEALCNRGNVLSDLKRSAEALASYDRAVSINPDYAEAHLNRGNILSNLKRFNEALASYDRALSIKPDLEFAFGTWLHTKMKICNWNEFNHNLNKLAQGVERGEKIVTPFSSQSIFSSALLQKKIACCYAETNYPSTFLLPALKKHVHQKIKIAYFSPDFRIHPVAYLTAELFERHNRTRFEIIAFSFHDTEYKDEMRLRLEATFDHFIDVSQQSDEQVVRLARQLEIDIAVDLNGFTDNGRTHIFAMRAAPVQVNYLGYSGTMGAEYMDYLLADPVLIPTEYQAYYTEKIACLPDSYMVCDSTRAISDKQFTRTEFGLPEQGFVFCCFNNAYKITPAVFDVWMRLLHQVKGSVLWLSENHSDAVSNLRQEARARGIEPERLVFARRLPLSADHLARHRLADLFLDTLPYNAHTTSSDALWAGLPVLTCVGEAFASRVAASLLTAIGLPELITTNAEDYEALAIQLATHPEQLAIIKQKLADNRLTYPLFDTALFTLHIETAYQAMFDRYQAGLAPDHIYVPASKRPSPEGRGGQKPQSTPAWNTDKFQQAFSLHQQEQLYEAEMLYEQILQTDPQNADVLHFLGVLKNQTGQAQRAVELITQSLAFYPNNVAAHSNLAQMFEALNRFDEALASYNRALAIKPDSAELHLNRANLLLTLHRFELALESYDKALAIQPDSIEALCNRGITLQNLERFELAVANYDHALTIQPNHADILTNRGNALKNLNRLNDALDSYDRALVIVPGDTETLTNRGNVLLELKRFDNALDSYNHALAIQADYAEAFYGKGVALLELKRFDEAIESCDRALTIRPDYVEALCCRALALQELNHWNEALVSYEHALVINPEHKFLFGGWLFLKMRVCDWHDIEQNLDQLKQKITQGKRAFDPFSVLAISSSLALQKKAADIYVQDKYANTLLLPPIKKHSHQKIKIGYFSADFYHHATAYLMVELFERHDRSKFEIIAFSFNPISDKDDMRLRLEAIFDQFIDVSEQTDEQVVQLARQMEVDIAVDLKGFTQHARPGLFVIRIAPVQVNYLGYPGTMSIDSMDYLLADSVLIPTEYQHYYTEFCVYLPNSYQVNDSSRPIANKVFTHTELGLPEQGFVFCCFNNNYKITPEIFNIWMRLLHQVKGSVLWLLEDNSEAVRNLRLEAKARNIDANRLIFAKRLPLAEHLARHRLADLFLDTLPYNAHTTSSDALWAGLPVLTCVGETFASRVAASLLSAIGLPELITTSLEDYEALAHKLATHPEQLAIIKQKLADNRLTYPLFDTALFTQHIEAAYQAIFDRYQAGLAPDHIYVPDCRMGNAIEKPVTLALQSSNAPVLRDPEVSFEQAFEHHQQGQLEQAKNLYQQILPTQPEYADALHLLGVIAKQQGQNQRAVDLISQALTINSDNAAAHSNIALAFQTLGRFDDALASYDRALIIQPDYAEALFNRGITLQCLKRLDEAVASYDHALVFQPNNTETLFNRGVALQNLKRYDEALISYGRTLAINPDYEFLFGEWLHIKMNLCDWNDFNHHLNKLENGIQRGEKIAFPFAIQALPLSPSVQKKAACCYAEHKYPNHFLLPPLKKHAHQKIKIAYFSSDFRYHPVTQLTAELFERHDRTRFEIIAFSFHTASDKDSMRLRLEAAFDQFIDISQQSDEQVVQLARQLEIDIAVDLNGFTEGGRPNLFAMRAAPVQVSYLGYLGTMGTDTMDYLLADETLIPVEHQPYYCEFCAYLPHSFQVNDSKLAIADQVFTRAELGLPEQGFIFCCFNANFKIIPAVFDAWMRILHQVEGSVLWLFAENGLAEKNLRLEAIARGINSERLIFAKRRPMPEYLATQRVADLFLDTSPYNAGATASAALWAGLPVLTYLGDTFSGRMGASLLHAIGLPELITLSLEDYEALAIQLATHPEQLAIIKQKLADNRLTYPLFDTVLFTQHIESAYQAMFDRYQADLAPDHIYVASRMGKPIKPIVENKPLGLLAKIAQKPAQLFAAFRSRKNNMTSTATPSDFEQFEQAQRLFRQGQLVAAEILYEEFLKIQPQHTEALRCLMMIKKQREQTRIATDFIASTSHSIRPELSATLRTKDPIEWAHSSSNAHPESYAGTSTEAFPNESLKTPQCLDNTLIINSDAVEALINHGNDLEDLDRLDEALASYDRAIAIAPNYARARSNRGNVLQTLKRFDEAIASYDYAITIKPDYAEAFYNRGNALQASRHLSAAIASYDRALSIKPDFIQAFISRGNALHDCKQFSDALQSYDRALAIAPDYAEVFYNRGCVLLDLKRYDEACISYEQALAIKPDYEFLFSTWLHTKMNMCAWDRFEHHLNRLANGITDGEKIAVPFLILSMFSSAALQKKAASYYTEDKYPDALLLPPIAKHSHQKIKVGYFSSDFRNHPVACLMAELFERHDRSRFEIIAFSFHETRQKDDMRLRLEAAFDQFIDVSQQSDEQVVQLARLMEIDIAVDLMGFTKDCRTNIFAMRAAPVQVNYLGYSGTMGAEYMDYLLADSVLIPPEYQPYYTERIAYLPDSYMVCDSTRAISDKQFTRAEFGLPEQGFVFCCFNNAYKITPAVFDVWMRLLHQVEGSVLWLSECHSDAVNNLQREARARGVDASRLIFAKRLPLMADHLARHRLADLFLDTLPYNAHTTSSDALWAGLPVLTCAGEAFASRVAASLLSAIGLPELITTTLEDYETLAHKLATNPDQLAIIKQKLADNRLTYPLFDTLLFTQYIEAAYQAMIDRYQADLAPDYIHVPASSMGVSQPTIPTPNLASPNNVDKFQQAFRLHQQGQLEQAEALYQELLKEQPQHIDALHFSGVLAHQRGQEQQAVDLIRRAIDIAPNNSAAHSNLGLALFELKRFDEAIASYDRALIINPNNADAHFNRGHALKKLKHFSAAINCYEQALVIKPDLEFISDILLCSKLSVCNWDKFDYQLNELATDIDQDKKIAIPFSVLILSSSVALQKKAAEAYTKAKHPSAFLLPALKKHAHQKIRLAYFSADFRHHPVAYLTAELFERHDRTKFEIIAFSFHPAEQKDDMSLRLEAGFDQFIDVSQQSDEQVVQLARLMEIDIAVDLNGCTEGCRTDIFAMRAAPVQVNYLGYSGTMGAEYMDYLLADSVLIPPEYQAYYTEKIAWLPDSFMVSDSTHAISDRPFTRTEFGLPEQGFVFCCFNHVYKITPAVFDVWMRLLHQVKGSVLWLSESHSDAVSNLQREAKARGVDARRLIFAKRLPLSADHLARHRLADLFLDTLPYNAHTTSSDALWAGLPVLTCVGAAFASRVAASLLSAIGLPELITTNLEDYEALAHKLATHPEQLDAIKQKLADNRLSYPLFNTALFTQHIEAAYQAMFDRYQADLAPDHIHVSAVGINQPATEPSPATFEQAFEYHQQGQLEQAKNLYQQILPAQPEYADALHLLGVIAKQQGQNQRAVDLISQALTINSDNAAAHSNIALAFQALGRFDDALASYDRALIIQPDYAEALFNRGITLQCLKRLDEAVASYDLALVFQPDNAETLFNRGVALQDLKRYEPALASYNRALSLKPDYAEALYNRGNTLLELKRYEVALDSYERARTINPDLAYIFGDWFHLKMNLCDWHGFSYHLDELGKGIERGDKIATPFVVQALPLSPSVQKKAACCYAEHKYPNHFLLPPLKKHTHKKIKIAYFSSDFRYHPVTQLTAELFERHDRSRFEIIAFSFHAANSKDEMRLKLETVFDQFIDVSQQSDEQVVQLARQLEIDIAVDLNGFTEGGRPNLFAMRAAPVQVSYLGYLGTMGTDTMDYLLADETLIPVEHQPYYCEFCAYLPNSFQVNDSKLAIAEQAFTRAELGLPEQGFIFCCFNANFKIIPTVFDCWMRILHQVEDSVLWLFAENGLAEKNLRLEAIARGINSERLIFAKRRPMPEYLATQRVADLFLDTSPYNAGATASAALWAGLPVLTYRGDTFSGRMGASLLHAIGLPELITLSLEDYEALAIQLATHPEQLAIIKQKLADNRLTYPLFDTALFTLHIEAAYQAMFDRYQADLAPDHIYVNAHATIDSQQNQAIPAYSENFHLAFNLHQQGQLNEAEALYEQILQTDPQNADVLHFLGVLKNQTGQTQRAVELITQSLELYPNNVAAHSNLAVVLEALNRFDDALASYDHALAINPNSAELHLNRANLLLTLHRFEFALESYDKALSIQPDSVEALCNRGVALQHLKCLDDALANYDHVLTLKPDHAEVLTNRGNVLIKLKRFDEALASYDRALAITPDDTETLINRGNLLQENKRLDEAVSNYDRVLALSPDNTEALCNRGTTLESLKRYSEALANFEQALSINPDYNFLFCNWLFLKMKLCDWNDYEHNFNQFSQKIAQGKKAFNPFSVLAISSSVAVQKKAAEIYIAAKHPSALLLPPLKKHTHQKIRLAYFSADFCHHPVAYLTAELFERHDRAKFEIIAFSFHSAEQKDDMTLRLEAGFDQFIDVSLQSDEQVVQLARLMEIDIAIDLNGYTEGSRTDIFAMRAAPIQVNYLGYSGTMGAEYMDYLLADSVLIPAEYQPYYTECCAWLPDSYMASDSTRAISDRPFTRAEFGLPEQGFVFCCFNQTYKITPTVFDVWMRLLHQIEGSVLWLSACHSDAVSNLQREAIARGIEPERRLVFAKRLPLLADHLARHRMADLFLDTSPYNAHTTSSDALWAGLPVLTCAGEAYASRVAASLLSAIGLPELITTSLEDYEALAYELATHPEQLAIIKQKLADNRLTYPLFDTALFTQHIEAAYQAMFDRYLADLAPDHITVPSRVAGRVRIAYPTTQTQTPSSPSNTDKFQQAMRLHQQGQLEQAEALYQELLKEQPQHVDALHFSGVLAHQRGQDQQAVDLISLAIDIAPDNLAAHSNLGLALFELKRFDEAIASYDRALSINPNNANACFNRGNALQALKYFDQALDSYECALVIKPDYIEALSKRGIMLRDMKRFDEALDNYERILAIKPDSAEAEHACGVILQDLNRSNEAIVHYGRALAIKPDMDFIFGIQLHLKMNICYWDKFDQHLNKLVDGIARGERIIDPFSLLALPSSAALQKKAAETYTEAKYPGNLLLPPLKKHAHQKIRLGYFSSDFRHHAITYLMAELFGHHDRSKFEIIAFSLHETTHKDDMRLRLEATFDQFIDVSQQSDEQVVQLARQLGCDIAVDLNGHTEGCRTGIFAMRAAPVQVSYLGYLGTMGADYMDYLLADKTLIPVEHQAHYSEKIAYLPHSFQVNDSTLRIADTSVTRTELGLPEQGFVFCCFNNHYKITPTVFDSWMRILHQVDGSVLWLQGDNVDAETNLRLSATARGINAERLVFAKRVPMPEYLARHHLADLFLDTAPYNAGATASAALWAGLPVLSCLGDTFSGRMAASLLNAIGLPELITLSLADYEALAIQLATHPEQLATIKQTLADNRLTYPLFDTALFTLHIEAAYQTMFDRYQADLAPDHIYVSAVDIVHPATPTQNPSDHANTFQHVLSLHQQGRLAEAEAGYETLLQTEPQHIDALHFLGVLKHQNGQSQLAVDLIQQALKLHPDNVAAHANLGMVLQSLNRFDDALISYNKILELKPGNIATLSALGTSLQMLNRFDEALNNYDRLLAIEPDHAEALLGRANVLHSLKRSDEAVESYKRSLAINPDNFTAFYNQGIALGSLNRVDEAISSYQYAIAIKSDYVDAHCDLITLLRNQGRTQEVETSSKAALAIMPDSLKLRFTQLIMTLPMMPKNAIESALVPERFDNMLTELENHLATTPAPLSEMELLPLPFLLAYRAGNHVQRLSRYGDLVANHGVWERSDSVQHVESGEKKIKILVVSHHFRRHSVWNVITRGLLVNLDRSRFELILYHLDTTEDQETALAKSLADTWRDAHTITHLNDWLSAFDNDAPDVIFYPEIGMDSLSASLAAQRIAPLQIASWGHPITTGLPTIDLYFSGDKLESPDADSHYRERLIRLPGTGCCTTPINTTPEPIPELEAELTSRQGVHFVIAQSIYKFDPADDALYADIASAVGECTFILLRDSEFSWASDQILSRLEQTFTERGLNPEQYLLMLPWQTMEKFQNLLDLCDVYLDCPSFSGYTTAWQAVHRGLPIVTLEGEFMRQRLAAGLLRKIGLTDTIVSSREAYVQCALKLAEECRDPVRRTARRVALKTAAPKADNDVSVVRAFEQHVINALAERGR